MKQLIFSVQQIALAPPDTEAAIALLKDMGMGNWSQDVVLAHGEVFGKPVGRSVGSLAFNYEGLAQARELEVLGYIEGANWMERHGPSASHIGTHCTDEELEQWRKFFARRKIKVAQELHTESHTNPAIDGKRWYHYVIFDTRPILGVDVKFIVRNNEPPDKALLECLKCGSQHNGRKEQFNGQADCQTCGESTNHLLVGQG